MLSTAWPLPFYFVRELLHCAPQAVVHMRACAFSPSLAFPCGPRAPHGPAHSIYGATSGPPWSRVSCGPTAFFLFLTCSLSPHPAPSISVCQPRSASRRSASAPCSRAYTHTSSGSSCSELRNLALLVFLGSFRVLHTRGCQWNAPLSRCHERIEREHHGSTIDLLATVHVYIGTVLLYTHAPLIVTHTCMSNDQN